MTDYDYLEAMMDDVADAIEGYDLSEFEDRAEFEDKLYEDLWIDDGVTGNGSGSYTFNSYVAEEYICHNLDLLHEALCDFGVGGSIEEKGAEWADVTIRCYLLPEAISKVLDEMDLPWDC